MAATRARKRIIYFVAALGGMVPVLVLTGTLKIYSIPSSSGAPTLVPGDGIFATRDFGCVPTGTITHTPRFRVYPSSRVGPLD